MTAYLRVKQTRKKYNKIIKNKAYGVAFAGFNSCAGQSPNTPPL